MTSILSAPGKYRSRKDISTGSIPTLVSLDEESSLSTTTTTSASSDTVLLQSLRAAASPSAGSANSAASSSSSHLNIKNGLASKPPRRSSLGLALLGGGGSRSSGSSEKGNKRRSSIAVVFLGGGRKDSKSTPSPAAVNGGSPHHHHHHHHQNHHSNNHHHHSHHHNGHSISTIPEKYIKTGESDIENDSPNTDTFTMLSPGLALGEGSVGEGLDSYGAGGGSGGGGYDKKRRRSSSWQTKLERRRRKGMMALDGGDPMPQDSASFSSFGSANGLDTSPYASGSGGKYGREKRHSWWNIFVPDNLKQRTRRASQDVILSKSSDTLSSPPYRRSKSRSVDHGLAAPFDLDSLRSKVEGRFESIDRLSKDGEKKRSMPTIPTITYTVKDRDTLTSVAARFDTTPSELTQLNRLASSFIYSGQQLLVPDKNAKSAADGESDASTERSSNSPTDGRRKGSQEDLSQDEKDLLEGLRPGSPKPGHIERVASPNTQSGGGGGGGGGGSSGNAAAGGDEDDPVTIQRFLKINVRHITDGQGVVGGVLLVTPNAVMFDPNVSDPLVIEHGPESYGVIAPMEFIVNAAIFNDIAHMRVQGAAGGNETAEKAEIYHPVPVEKPCSRCDTHSPGKDSLLVKDETFPELGVGSVEGCDDQESICSSNERDGDAFPKAFERDLVTPNNLQRLHGDSTESGGSSVEPKASSAEPPMFLSYDRDSSQSHTPNSLDNSATGAAADQQASKSGGDKTDQTKTNSILEDPTMRSLEERRRSLLDQHWAIPSKDRLKCNCDQSSSRRSLDDEEAASTGSGATAASSSTAGASSIGAGHHVPPIAPIAEVAVGGDGQLVKQSCHDSGIDIRDPGASGAAAGGHGAQVGLGGGATGGSGSSAASSVASIPIVAPIATKKVYSDADIVLSADWVPPLTIAPTHLHDSSPRSSSSLVSSSQHGSTTLSTVTSDAGGRKKTSSVSFSVDEHDPHGAAGPAGSGSFEKGAGETKKNKMLKRLSYPLAWVEGLTGEGGSSHKSDSIESAPNTGDSNQSVFSKVFSRRSSIGTFIRQHPSEGSAHKQKQAPPKLDYRSMVSIDDMPTLFVSFDKLIPRPARACPDPPMYLRLRMGRKIGKNTPLPTTVMSYGKNKLRPEYWFSIPKNKVDELYRFLNAWVQHLYGELDEAAIKERGFELIQIDTEWSAKTGSPSKDGRSASEGEISEYTRESWEVLSMSTDDYRKATLFASGSFDQDFQIPDLIGQTEILSEEHREKLCAHLPARAEGYSWSLVFSTSQHGFSLNSLYRKMHKLESPILIVIEDTDHNVFGALTSCSLHVSDHFYGTGESLLYKFNPHFKVFHWSGENLYFIKGNPESLAIGAGDGKFGLWLDGDLNQGRSQHCSTYSNEPLAPQEDFVIKTLECWAFV
ncbi:AGAP001751-PA-like protein [Anopheles sinensis]|uniref:Oxidation resistance protein 1 n=1 Tax=Anopheles sinensis TaxID=74873 RepID=A0A084W302_ANOSI|nr:AGAP001751-PA-like protein [Anopheles sinensis]